LFCVSFAIAIEQAVATARSTIITVANIMVGVGFIQGLGLVPVVQSGLVYRQA